MQTLELKAENYSLQNEKSNQGVLGQWSSLIKHAWPLSFPLPSPVWLLSDNYLIQPFLCRPASPTWRSTTRGAWPSTGRLPLTTEGCPSLPTTLRPRPQVWFVMSWVESRPALCRWRVADLGVSGHPSHHGDPAEAGQGPGVQLQGDRHQQGGKVRP